MLMSIIPHKVLCGQAQTITASNHNEEQVGSQEGQSSTSLLSCMAKATAYMDTKVIIRTSMSKWVDLRVNNTSQETSSGSKKVTNERTRRKAPRYTCIPTQAHHLLWETPGSFPPLINVLCFTFSSLTRYPLHNQGYKLTKLGILHIMCIHLQKAHATTSIVYLISQFIRWSCVPTQEQCWWIWSTFIRNHMKISWTLTRCEAREKWEGNFTGYSGLRACAAAI
jgi:hypothetical protein